MDHLPLSSKSSKRILRQDDPMLLETLPHSSSIIDVDDVGQPPPSPHSTLPDPSTTAAPYKFAFRFGIATKLSLLVGLLTLLSVGILALVTWFNSSQILQNQLESHIQSIAILQHRQLNNYFGKLSGNTKLISNRVLLQTFLRELLTPGVYLNNTSESTGNIDLASAINTLSDVVAATIYTTNFSNIIFRANNSDILDLTLYDTLRPPNNPVNMVLTPNETLRISLHPPINSSSSLGLLWSFSTVVPDTSNTSVPLGVITMIMTTNGLNQITSDTSGLGDTGFLIVGYPINSTAFSFILPPVRDNATFGETYLISDYPAMQMAFQNQTGVINSKSFNGNTVVAAYQPIFYGDWGLVAQIEVGEIYAPVQTLRVIIVVATILTFVLATIASILFSRVIISPVSQLAFAASAFSKGDKDARAREPKRQWWPDQLTELIRVFNFMADKIEQHQTSLENTVAERTRELNTALKEADSANAAKSRFLANMSHEIRTPLNAILNISRLCLEDEQGIQGDSRRLINLLRSSGDHLLTLVDAILDASRIEAGVAIPSSSPFRLRRVMNQLRSMFYLPAEQKNVNFVCVVDSNVPEHLRGDPKWLLQILINLANNAIKFTSEGSINIRVRLVQRQSPSALASSSPAFANVSSFIPPTPPADESESDRPFTHPITPINPITANAAAAKNEDMAMLEFSVTDTGIGIPSNQQHLLFQSFSQLDGSHSRRYGGAGLGLSISKQFVELMGGDIWVESDPNRRGSTFIFRVPFPVVTSEEVKQVERRVRSSTASTSGGVTRPLRILLAEDNLINQDIAKRLLSRMGRHQVVVANNGLEAVRLFERSIGNEVLEDDASIEEGFDVILMDIQMPEMDGIAATERIRSIETDLSLKPVPIIALTAHALSSDREICLNAGMDAFVTKPIDIAALKRAIDDVMNEQKAPEEGETDISDEGSGSLIAVA